MPEYVPLIATPNQTFAVPLGEQNCRLTIYQRTNGIYIDVEVDEEPIILNVLCQDRNRIVRNRYLGFLGDLAFVDLQGTSDPEYTGLGGRYQLLYLTEDEVPEGNQ